jgi:hypothetical protein
MTNTKLIVTLAIGKLYSERWRALCKANWERYAARYGYDVLAIEQPLDSSPRAAGRSPAWQKCLILSDEHVKRYERVVWLDADVLINCEAAPDITDGVPIEKVGAVNGWISPSPAMRSIVLKRQYEIDTVAVRDWTAQAYHTNFGLPDQPAIDKQLQTGVMVLSPIHHRELMEHVYQAYEDRGGPTWHYEMRPLSYELIASNCVEWIDPRFNVIWADYKLAFYPFLAKPRRVPDFAKGNSAFSQLARKILNRLHLRRFAKSAALFTQIIFNNSYFLHFAGAVHDIHWLDPTPRDWKQFKMPS